MDRRSHFRLAVALVFFVALALAACFSLRPSLDWDEIESVHTAWKVGRGEVIYRDFFQIHHPLVYFVLAPVIRLCGEQIAAVVAIKALVFLIVALMLRSVYRITLILFDDPLAAFGSVVILLSCLYFIHPASEIRPDTLALFLVCESYLSYLIFTRSRRLTRIAVAGLALALAFLTQQKTLAFVILFIALVAGDLAARKVSAKEVIVCLGSFTAALALFGAWLWAAGAGARYAELCWGVNAGMIMRRPLIDPRRAVYLACFIVSAAPIIACALWSGISSRDGRARTLLVAAAALSVPMLFSGVPYAQYTMLPLPFLAVAASRALSGAFRTPTRALAAYLAIVVFGAAVLVWRAPVRLMELGHTPYAKLRYVLSQTAPGDYVYDGLSSFNLFRKDLDFFWLRTARGGTKNYVVRYMEGQGMTYDLVALIGRLKPRIISRYGITEPSDRSVFGRYRPSERYPDLLVRVD